MRHFIDYITEKLKITKDTKINDNTNLKDLSTSNVPRKLLNEMTSITPNEENTHYNKMEAYKKKGSKPERLLNSIKDRTKLIYRWYVAIIIDWLDCAKVFKQGIIDRGYYSEDDLDSYILYRYNQYLKNSKVPNVKEAVEKYFDEYNIKY